MPTYVVTTSNWNSPAFWAAITEIAPGGALNFSGLPSDYSVDVSDANGLITITNGLSTFVIGDDTSTGADVTMGAGTLLDNFTNVIFPGGNNSSTGGVNADTLTGGLGDDTFYGGDGNDSVSGNDGNDFVLGELGDDTLVGGNGNDTLSGGIGNDSLLGGNSDDSLLGGDGNDFLDGGYDHDTLDGGAGDDTLAAGFGSDTFIGGSGNDVLQISGTLVGTYGFEINLTTGTDGYGNTYSGIERILGGSGNDGFTGDTANNLLVGNDGSDRFYLLDNFGTDTIIGGDGGSNVDEINFSGLTSGITITHPSGGSSTATHGTDTLTFTGIEQIVLTNFSDNADFLFSGPVSLDGGAGNDTISGSDFAGAGDTISGGAGNDSLIGNTGDDSLSGGSDNDILDGSTGNDTLDGGAGNDTLIGGYGADAFIGGTGTDTFQIGGTSVGAVSFNIDLGAGTDTYGNTYSGIERIVGGSNNDTLTAAATESVYFDGGDGADSLTGSDLTDTLQGGDGTDTLVGGGGNDTIYMGAGDDIAYGGDGDDEFNTQVGNDTVFAGAGNDSVYGWYVDTNLYVDGGAGNDVIFGSGTDTLLGGDGDDTIGQSNGNASLVGGAGNDYIENYDGNATISGGTGNDEMYGNDDEDSFLIEDSFGTDTIEGGEGGTDFDRIDGSALGTGVSVVLNAGEAGTFSDGTDTLAFSEIESFDLTNQNDSLDNSTQSVGIEVDGLGGNDTLTGGAGADTLAGGDGDDLIDGGAGDDFLTTGLGQDTLLGGTGNDTLMNSDGDDSLDGGDGDDSIVATGGEDTLRGGAGNDTMDGGDDADTFIIEDGFGNDVITGGEGTTDPGDRDADTIDLSAMTGPVTVTYTGDEAGTITDGNDTITFSEIEGLILTDSADVVDASADGAGIDVVAGGGDDTITGGSGDDTINAADGNSSADVINSGAGNDSVSVDGNDTVHAGDGADTVNFGYGNLGEAYGEGGDDSLTGSNGDQAIYGGDGNDTITGGSEYGTYDKDTLDGGDGNDLIISGNTVAPVDESWEDRGDLMIGGAGDDTLVGGGADDTLDGGTGNDSMTGGEADDTFVYSPGGGNDTITDFNTGNSGTLDDGDSTNNDYIDLSGFYDHISELYADQADDGILNQSNTTDTRGETVDYSDNSQFSSGEGITFSGASADESSFTQENTGVVCFGKGTLITTPNGSVPIETLRPGDLVQTMDNGTQPLAWNCARYLGAKELAARPNLKPVLLKQGEFGGTRDLIVSPQHGMLIGLDGEETLVRAIHLARLHGGQVRQMLGCREVTYHHLMFDAHQIIFANGKPTESLYPGREALRALAPQSKQELRFIFPELMSSAALNAAEDWEKARYYAERKALPPSLNILKPAELV